MFAFKNLSTFFIRPPPNIALISNAGVADPPPIGMSPAIIRKGDQIEKAPLTIL